MSDHPDFLRSLSNIFLPDPRSVGFSILDENGLRTKTLEDHQAAVAQLVLHDGVPRQIVAKFETAKNLNLFAWFVYRFHSAARSHVYECLELALRIRFKDELYCREEKRRHARYEEHLKNGSDKGNPYQPMDKETFRPTLHPLLEYAIETGVLKNENFRAWQSRTTVRARSQNELERIQKMNELGLSELHTDNSTVEITDQDRDHDYLRTILQTIPFLRNHYAHGTSALDNKSLGALRLASEIINQIFPVPGHA